jgi:HK97 family phage prohead protease
MSSIIYKSCEFKDFDESKGLVSGYGSVFGNMDSDRDIIQRGAYTKTLAENLKRIKYYYQHDLSRPIGKFVELYQDDYGLKFTAQLALETIDGKDSYEKMKFGLIEENSVGIIPTKAKPQDGKRMISEVKLFEISAVSLAANDMATMSSVKNLEPNQALKLQDRADKIQKMLKKANISDECGYALEAEILSLKTLIEETTKPSADTLPEEVTKADYLNYLKQNLTL